MVRQSLSDVSRAEGSLSVESVTQAQRQRLPSSPQKGLDQEQEGLAGKGPRRFGSALHLLNFWYDI